MKPIPIERADPSRSNYDDWVESDEYYPEERFDFTSGDLDYLGKHTVHKISIMAYDHEFAFPSPQELFKPPY